MKEMSSLHTYCVLVLGIVCMNEMRLGENYFQVVFCTSFCCAEHCLGFPFVCFTYSFRWGAIPNRIWIIDLISDCSAFDTTRWFGFWRRVQIGEISLLDFFFAVGTGTGIVGACYRHCDCSIAPHSTQSNRFGHWHWKQYRVCTNHAIALNLFYWLGCDLSIQPYLSMLHKSKTILAACTCTQNFLSSIHNCNSECSKAI